MTQEYSNQNMIQIGERLLNFRETLGYSRDDFAKTLDITVDHYRKIENGKVNLKTDKIAMLSKQYNIDITYILTGKQSPFIYKGKRYGSLEELWDASDDQTKLELCKEVLGFKKEIEQRKLKHNK
jgi:transcriptional regulator with XRE-family HTH domain